jgi:hypothetical protein
LLHWDCSTDLLVRRTAAVDAKEVRRDCGFGRRDEVRFRLAATWRCGGNPLRRCLCTKEIAADTDRAELSLEGLIPGSELAEKLTLETLLVLVDASAPSPLSPSRPGSILWRDGKTVLLEGLASRFPIEVADFEALYQRPGAAWYLEWNCDDMTVPVRRGLRLLVNQRHPRVVLAATRPSASAESKAIASAIYCDVARSLICGALRSEDFRQECSSYEDDSVGKAIYGLLRDYFPGRVPDEIYMEMLAEPEEFNASIQAAAGLFRD